MEILYVLIFFLLGLITINIVYNIFIYFINENKTDTIVSIIIWVSQFFFFLATYLFGKSKIEYELFFGFSLNFFTCIGLIMLLVRFYAIKVNFKMFYYFAGFCLVLSLALFKLTDYFEIYAFPIALSISTPLLVTLFKIYKQKKVVLTNKLDYFFLGLMLVWAIHYLDYPFLRHLDVPFAPIAGYTLAITLVYLLSIVIPVKVNMAVNDKFNKELKIKVEEKTKELRSAQSQLIQSEKLSSLGQLTAGVAHELNNPINFIGVGSVGLGRDIEDLMELLEKYERLDIVEEKEQGLEEIRAHKVEMDYDFLKENIVSTITDIQMGSKRITNIVKGLHSFSRMDAFGNKVPTNIHKGIDDTLIILNTVLKYKVTVIRNYDEEVKELSGYPGQLNQVFMNIIANAEQSIIGEGTITITTKDEGNGVTVTISDTGCGMSKEVQSRALDPFFTTKAVGSGTGLGLSISYGIIKTHNGTINIESEINKGSKFIIYLPY